MTYPEKEPETGGSVVNELKNEYGGKKNNWIPVDKNAAIFLPTDREYTKLEALFSYQKDLDEDKDGTLAGYARLWKWSRTKVRKFLSELETDKGHLGNSKRTGKKQSIHVINKNLWEAEKQKKNSKRTDERQMKDTTVHPNPNPTSKKENTLSDFKKKNPTVRVEYSKNFELFWETLPPQMKVGKKNAFKHYRATVKNDKDYADLKIALEKYQNCDRFKRGFIQNGSTWFNNWRDWLNYVEPTDNGKAKTWQQKRIEDRRAYLMNLFKKEDKTE